MYYNDPFHIHVKYFRYIAKSTGSFSRYGMTDTFKLLLYPSAKKVMYYFVGFELI